MNVSLSRFNSIGKGMEGDRSFEDFFHSLGISVVVCTMAISCMKHVTEYYFVIVMSIVCVVTLGVVIYERHIPKDNNEIDESSILSLITCPIHQRHVEMNAIMRRNTFHGSSTVRKARIPSRPTSAYLHSLDTYIEEE